MKKSSVKLSKKDLALWAAVWLLILIAFFMTFLRTPEQITATLMKATREMSALAVINHALLLVVLAAGLVFKKARNILFASYLSYISLSALVVSIVFMIVPNIIIFAMFLLMILWAYRQKRLNFEIKSTADIRLLFAAIGILFGFWYLHWVESPVALNAFVFSPLGIVNCPTMAMTCGFLCLVRKPRSVLLESVVAIVTLYFGFFGLFRLGAYVDVALVICALFLILRVGSSLDHDKVFGQ